MNIGLVARSENRGLGILTWEWYRHMHPARTMVVTMGDLRGRFDDHLDRYPDATVVPFTDGTFDEDVVRGWLDGLDVVYSAETFYDWRMVEWARQAGVATVVHVMPEFHRHHGDHDLPTPDAWWLPTGWLADRLPCTARMVPVPVSTDRAPIQPQTSGRCRWVHTAGHVAAADRNGTVTLYRALPYLTRPADVTILTQDDRLPVARRSAHVQLHVEHNGRPDYWDNYTDADMLVLPRRYGGLSLPVQEALAAGLGVVLPDIPPNHEWPGQYVQARYDTNMPTPGGPIPIHTCNPRHLAEVMDRFADPNVRAVAHTHAVEWTANRSWDALRPLVVEELARAASR